MFRGTKNVFKITTCSGLIDMNIMRHKTLLQVVVLRVFFRLLSMNENQLTDESILWGLAEINPFVHSMSSMYSTFNSSTALDWELGVVTSIEVLCATLAF